MKKQIAKGFGCPTCEGPLTFCLRWTIDERTRKNVEESASAFCKCCGLTYDAPRAPHYTDLAGLSKSLYKQMVRRKN
jgi:hypothetical protein